MSTVEIEFMKEWFSLRHVRKISNKGSLLLHVCPPVRPSAVRPYGTIRLPMDVFS